MFLSERDGLTLITTRGGRDRTGKVPQKTLSFRGELQPYAYWFDLHVEGHYYRYTGKIIYVREDEKKQPVAVCNLITALGARMVEYCHDVNDWKSGDGDEDMIIEDYETITEEIELIPPSATIVYPREGTEHSDRGTPDPLQGE